MCSWFILTDKCRSANRPNQGIRGPRSALTDFLSSQNIQAHQIRANANARRAAAALAAAANVQNNADGDDDADDDENEEDNEAGGSTSTTASRARAREQKKQKQEAAIAKIKESKLYIKKKQQKLAREKKHKRKRGGDSPDLPESDSDDLARALLDEKPGPVPGQMANCEICDKRFTVTPYSRAGPNGGMLCSPCGKKLAKDQNDAKKNKKPKLAAQGGGGRRKMQSRILDGTYHVGAKPLMNLCIETLAKNIQLADGLGDLPPRVVDLIARKLSKHRLLGPDTLRLFLDPRNDAVSLYDAARLSSQDYVTIFQQVTQLKKLKLRNAIQFKDEVMQYLITRNLNLDSIYLHGANLVSEACWIEYLKAKGEHLKALQIYYMDKHVNDAVVSTLKVSCPSLTRLKLCHNQEVSDDGIKLIANLVKLEHLSLQLIKKTKTDPYVAVVQSLGKQLQTLSLKNIADVDNRLLDAIHENCTSLKKLRVTDSEHMTDAGFARMFKGWKNRALVFLDLQKCRHVDPAKPRENEHMVGLCSEGFRAIMTHSGTNLRYLNIHACRHISAAAFEEVFAEDKVYPQLSKLEISFCEEVTDFIVGSIFRCCPALKELNVKHVKVPKGRILVGVPNAIGMQIEGVDD
ncbi:Uu.00g089680.m01.CDS01 [Anthostomella pinea]|uniref:Uu.00g089680.m01.CDS01 n=1 Tax=Anthostomella pinea TaxID=933095 RepID=A0AAI8VNE8_9PEZI|nr:Uu.00g089680.m01.CDS01 [Anthostomella pinea]